MALVRAVESGLKLEMLRHVRKGAARDPKHAEWMLTHHPSIRGEFGDHHQTTKLGRIKIDHLIQRDPAHRVPHLIDQDEEPAIIEAKAVEVAPVAEPVQINQQEPVEVEPEQEVIPTDPLEGLGRSAFDIQFRMERGLDDD